MESKVLFERLFEKTGRNISQNEISKTIHTTQSAISNRIKRHSEFSDKEVELLEKRFNVSLRERQEYIEIKYWEELPEDLKVNYITSLHFDRELIEDDWNINAGNLRIIPMLGDSMNTYTYPICNRDICIFDLSNTDLNKAGIYLISTNNNKNLYIRKVSLLEDGTIEFTRYENNEIIIRKLTPEKQKQVSFKVIGRVIKNASFII